VNLIYIIVGHGRTKSRKPLHPINTLTPEELKTTTSALLNAWRHI